MASDGAHPGDRETPASPGKQESPSHSPFRLKTYIHAFSTIVLQLIDLYIRTAIMYRWSVKLTSEKGDPHGSLARAGIATASHPERPPRASHSCLAPTGLRRGGHPL